MDNLLEKSDSANAETMLSVLEDVFERVGIEMSMISSMASDGSNVMTVKTGGFATR